MLNRMKSIIWGILYINHALALDKNWWKHSTICEIFTPSYKDSNGDGWGDLKGITSKLNYLENLGVDTIYLTPFHPSPLVDTGYDVADYYAIHPSFGTMADFGTLIRQLKKRGMKLIMDLIINHSSDQHQWFQKSVDRVDPYTDYYVWHDPKGYDNKSNPIVPNNWCLGFLPEGPSSWTWNEKRQQFYYHAFLPEQPDLNYRYPPVVSEMKKIIKFWLNKGVAGMRLDAVPFIMEDPLFEDEEPLNKASKGKQVTCAELDFRKRAYNKDTFHFLHEIRSYVDEISVKANTIERIVILEAFGDQDDMKKFYGNVSHSIAHSIFNYLFNIESEYLSPSNLNNLIDFWINIAPNDSALNWQLGSHDLLRMPFKFIQEYVNVLFTLISTLPGIMVLYYGEEIGMDSGIIRPNQRRKFNNDYARLPMQWDGSLNGGFSSSAKTWLPVSPNYWRLNVKEQRTNPKSVYHFIKSLLALRKTDTLRYGNFEKFILKDWIFVIKRSYNDETYVIVLNLGTERETILLDDLPFMSEVTVLKVLLSTANSKLRKGALVVRKRKRSFKMQPMSSVILSAGKNTVTYGFNNEETN